MTAVASPPSTSPWSVDEFRRMMHDALVGMMAADPHTSSRSSSLAKTKSPDAAIGAISRSSRSGPDDDQGDGSTGSFEEFETIDFDIEQLIIEHSDAVYRVAMSVTRDATLAEDVAQDSLLKAWQALPSYRGEAPLRNWILRITHNTAVSALRRRREELRDPSELPERTSYVSVEATVQNRLAFDRFTVALEGLDDVSRSIVALRELEGFSYDEICEILDLPLPTVKTRLLRARRQLARSLEGWRP